MPSYPSFLEVESVCRIKDIDFSSKEISVLRKGNKKDTVSVTLSSLHDLKEYLSIRNARYKGKDDENEFVFIKLYKGEPLLLTNFTDSDGNLIKA